MVVGEFCDSKSTFARHIRPIVDFLMLSGHFVDKMLKAFHCNKQQSFTPKVMLPNSRRYYHFPDSRMSVRLVCLSIIVFVF